MKSNQLTVRTVQAAKKVGYLCDGGGLYLQVSEYGTKSWVYRFMVSGRSREMGLGSLDTFTLKEARERARECRQLVNKGIDPIEARNQRRDRSRAEATEHMLFKDAAQRFVALHETTWKNKKHREQWKSTLRDYAYPKLGDRPVSVIDGALITEALAPIWTEKQETARRVKQRIERVVQWVKDAMPMPRQPASQIVRHHPALPFAELPAFMGELRQCEGVVASALEFTILTAARTSEAAYAKWSEIDFEHAVWTVPSERMKGGKEHEVPLSKRALSILQGLPREDDGYVFVGQKAGASIGKDAMLRLLRGVAPGLTVHGFRSTFRDWAGDRTHYAREVIEHALAHHIKDKAEASYRRSSALEKRRRLMEEWGKYCSSPAVTADVVSLHGVTGI
jgi:integrase